MAEDDIYGSKGKYERFLDNLERLLYKPAPNNGQRGKRKYYCKFAGNLAYFHKLSKKFSAKDLSYQRRIRLFRTLLITVHVSAKDLEACDREDIDEIVGFMHSVNKSIKTKGDFIIDIKYLWKNLFPEKDERGRSDQTLIPYPVRHLSGRMDKSKEKRRRDKLTLDEFESLVKAFSQDIRLQAYLTLAFESLGRPQEILYTRIRDLELFDNYGKIWISEHGKEGTGFLEIIDSYSYVANWYNNHPLRNNPDAFLFVNLGNTGKYEQLKPLSINKHIREKCRILKIDKPVTCYSLKRSGVTYRRLRGEGDAQIQHAARWTSTKQLKTYDLSSHDDTFNIALTKRGLIKDQSLNGIKQSVRACTFCETVNGIAHDFCRTCKRPLDRKLIVESEKKKDEEIRQVKNQYLELQKQLNKINSLMNKVVDSNPEIVDAIAREN